jgi:hypothetical protein
METGAQLTNLQFYLTICVPALSILDALATNFAFISWLMRTLKRCGHASQRNHIEDGERRVIQ